jgi:ATP adenylyltransferase
MGRPHHMGNTRVEDQRRKMELAAEKGHCTFCLEHLGTYHDAPIEREGEFWVVSKNDYPYSHARVHMLIIHKRHIEHDDELTDEEWTELRAMKRWISSEYKIPGGALFMRFGDENYSGGTLPHLHAHIVVPDLDDPAYESISCYVGTRAENVRSRTRTERILKGAHSAIDRIARLFKN